MFTSYAASFAAVWYVTETTGSAILLSAMSICAYLPQGILSPYGGVVADRYNRKAVIIAADMAVGLVSLALGLFILLGDVSIAAIMFMVVARSVGQAFHGPAMMAAMPMLVPEKHLLRINTLDMMLMSVAGIVSPALGIMLYEGVGFHAVMFLDFAGAALACLALVKAHIPSVHEEAAACEKRHPLAEMKEGWDALRANRGLFLLIVLITLGMVSFGPMGSLYPLMTYDHFGGDGFMAAVAEATFAGGLFVGSLIIMAWGGGKRLALLLGVSCVAFGVLATASWSAGAFDVLGVREDVRAHGHGVRLVQRTYGHARPAQCARREDGSRARLRHGRHGPGVSDRHRHRRRCGRSHRRGAVLRDRRHRLRAHRHRALSAEKRARA